MGVSKPIRKVWSLPCVLGKRFKNTYKPVGRFNWIPVKRKFSVILENTFSSVQQQNLLVKVHFFVDKRKNLWKIDKYFMNPLRNFVMY